MEAARMLLAKRGNVAQELASISEQVMEGTEIQTVTLYKLMKTFEKLMQRLHSKNNKPVHTVVRYNYTMDESRDQLLLLVKNEKKTAFEKIFEECENRIHAIFLFLSLLELVQTRCMNISVGEGSNNFILEWIENIAEAAVAGNSNV